MVISAVALYLYLLRVLCSLGNFGRGRRRRFRAPSCGERWYVELRSFRPSRRRRPVPDDPLPTPLHLCRSRPPPAPPPCSRGPANSSRLERTSTWWWTGMRRPRTLPTRCQTSHSSTRSARRRAWANTWTSGRPVERRTSLDRSVYVRYNIILIIWLRWYRSLSYELEGVLWAAGVVRIGLLYFRTKGH